MDYKEIKNHVGMERLLSEYGHSLDSKRRCACPIHGGSNKSAFSVSSDDQTWKCFTDCDEGGDIFTFVEKMEGCENPEARLKIEKMFNLEEPKPVRMAKSRTEKPVKEVLRRIEYQYTNKDGKTLYTVNRVDYKDGSKDCFQRCNGKNTLPPEVRTIYNLHHIHGSEGKLIYICEGEKTADALMECGYLATTNPLGSSNWEDRYAQHLKDKDIVIMPDADEQGEKWRDLVLKSTAGIVESSRVVNIPDDFIEENPKYKGHDFADFFEVCDKHDSQEWLDEATEEAEVMPRGVDPELLGRPCDILDLVIARAKLGIDTTVFNMREWLPTMSINVKKGDLIVLMANTGTGKTRVLHNIPYHIKRLNYAIFDLELSQDTIALRYAAMANNTSFDKVEKMIMEQRSINKLGVENVFLQKVPDLTVEKIDERVKLLERVTGREMHCVAVDYIGLMGGGGKAYEKTSANVEAFKAYTGQTGKVGILTTQVSRPDDREEGLYKCPSPFQAKNSGSVENSAQLLIGFWKDKDDTSKLWSRVMKYSHGTYPTHDVLLDAEDLLITDHKANRYEMKNMEKANLFE